MASYSLDVDPNDATQEVLTLRFPVGTIAATIGGAEHLFAQIAGQIQDIQRRNILQRYADLPVASLILADAAAQAAFAAAPP
jgi:hypothetical protein